MVSVRFVRYCVVIGALLLVGTLLATAQEEAEAAAKYRALLNNIDSLIRGPQRSDIPWRVQVRTSPDFGPVASNPWSGEAGTGFVDIRNHEGPGRVRPIFPILLLTRRTPVYIYAVVPYTFVRSGTHDLHLFVQIRDRAGRPLYSTASHPPVPSDAHYSIVWRAALWGRPGAYAASMVLYDGATGQSSVWHGRFDLQDLENNGQLPSLDTAGAQIALESDYAHRPGGLIPSLPLATRRPVQIDVIADFAETMGSNTDPFALQYTILATFFASRLQPARGCVRITALNALRGQVLADRVDPEAMKWNALSRKTNGARARNTIDIAALSAVQRGPAFLRDQVNRILSDRQGCSGLEADPLHLVILVAPGIRVSPNSYFRSFEHAALDPAQLPDPGNYRLYYLQTENHPAADYLRRILKPANENILAAHSQGRLRRALAKIVDALSDKSAEHK